MKRKGILFHLEKGDYFVTLATVLHFLADELHRMELHKSYDQADCLYLEHCLREACQELMFLQRNFKIVRR